MNDLSDDALYPPEITSLEKEETSSLVIRSYDVNQFILSNEQSYKQAILLFNKSL